MFGFESVRGGRHACAAAHRVAKLHGLVWIAAIGRHSCPGNWARKSPGSKGELQYYALQDRFNLLCSCGKATEEAERMLLALAETIALWRGHCGLLEKP